MPAQVPPPPVAAACGAAGAARSCGHAPPHPFQPPSHRPRGRRRCGQGHAQHLRRAAAPPLPSPPPKPPPQGHRAATPPSVGHPRGGRASAAAALPAARTASAPQRRRTRGACCSSPRLAAAVPAPTPPPPRSAAPAGRARLATPAAAAACSFRARRGLARPRGTVSLVRSGACHPPTAPRPRRHFGLQPPLRTRLPRPFARHPRRAIAVVGSRLHPARAVTPGLVCRGAFWVGGAAAGRASPPPPRVRVAPQVCERGRPARPLACVPVAATAAAASSGGGGPHCHSPRRLSPRRHSPAAARPGGLRRPCGRRRSVGVPAGWSRQWAARAEWRRC